MFNAASKTIFAVLALGASLGAANAETVRDHRSPEVRDHRVICVIGDPNCRDHRGPVIVVPPRDNPPIIVVDPLPRPHHPRPLPLPPMPPMPPIDPGDGAGHGHGHHDRISCSEGRQILRWEGFRLVRAFDCDGRTYGYRAEGRRGPVRIALTNRGDIIAIQRIR